MGRLIHYCECGREIFDEQTECGMCRPSWGFDLRVSHHLPPGVQAVMIGANGTAVQLVRPPRWYQRVWRWLRK